MDDVMNETTQAGGLSPEELERQRREAEEARLAPYRAFRRMAATAFRSTVNSGSVTDDEILAMKSAFPDWAVGVDYGVGDIAMSGGEPWECRQAHNSQADWRPSEALLVIWRRVKSTTSNAWQAGVAYAVNDVVTHGGKTYTCRQAHTSQTGWEPPNVANLWEEKK